MPDWFVKIVQGPRQSSPGALVGEFAKGVANVESVKYLLNDSELATWSFPTLDSKATLLDDERHEVQIWRDNVLKFWGPVIAEPQMGPERTQISCVGLWEYFKYRFVHRKLSYNADQLTIAWNLVNYAQTEWAGAGLNISPATFSPSGVTYAKTYLGTELPMIASAVQDFTKMGNGFDFAIEIFGDGRREWTPYFPSKGVTRSDFKLQYDQWGRRGIESFNTPKDGSRRANFVTTAGTGAGSLKLFSTWVDEAARDASVLMQAVESMNDIKKVAQLTERSKAEVAARKKFIQIPVLTLKETLDFPIIDVLKTGDIVPVDIDYGRAQLHGNFRVVAMDIKPGDAELIEVELNPA